MKLPENLTHVRVSGVEWVVKVDEVALADGGNYAVTDYAEQTIRVSERYPDGRTRVSFLHELTHVAGDPLDNDNKLTELQVKVVSAGLYEAIFCNPAVLEFLSHKDA